MVGARCMLRGRGVPRRLLHRSRRRRGFTLLEASVSVLIVGGLMITALSTVGAFKSSQGKIVTRGRAQVLAQGLMAEILSQAYEEPVDTPAFGRETGESGGARTDWDDVDDYHGWTASPPEAKDGTELADLDGWTRSVVVEWVNPADLTQSAAPGTTVKRITVTVKRGDRVEVSAVAIRTSAWPVDDSRLKVLLVVVDAGSPNVQEQARMDLMESWGYAVTPISASDTQSAFGAAVADADVAYVCEDINDVDLGSKLRNAVIGIVNEEVELHAEFGFSANSAWPSLTAVIEITNNTHYITSQFSAGGLTICSQDAELVALTGKKAPALQQLANYFSADIAKAPGLAGTPPGLAVIETGGNLESGGIAAERRVQVPWGHLGFDIDDLTADGQTMMKRSIEWAASREEPGAP